jgi:hypothetical protein
MYLGEGGIRTFENTRNVKIPVRKFTLPMLNICNLRLINKLWVHNERSRVPEIM